MDTPNEQYLPAKVQYSDHFNNAQAEVTYQSSDGVRFRIHAVYLKAHTEGLSPPQGSSLDEVVQLTEPAATLEALFKFIYPTRPPPLDYEVEFSTLKNLAEAAEKYQVFPAMYVCYLRMNDALPSHAAHVLAYALKHDYIDLMDKAAPHAVDVRLPDAIEIIPFEFHKAWITYYDKWLDTQKRALTVHVPVSYSNSYLYSLAASFSELRNPQTPSTTPIIHDDLWLYDPQDPLDECQYAAAEPVTPSRHRPNTLNEDAKWRASVTNDAQAIPRMSEIIARGGISEASQRDPIIHGPEDGCVRIESSDGIEHYMDCAVLRACSTGLDAPLLNKINLPEKSSTIAVLLQFIKPVRSPDLRTMTFEDLKDLAFAAEKYCVHQAAGICRVFMKNHIPRHPEDIFQYAAKFRYPDILDATAPLVLSTSFEDTVKRLPSDTALHYARYHRRWQEVVKAVIIEALDQKYTSSQNGSYGGHWNGKGRHCVCGGSFLESHMRPIIKRLLNGPGVLLDFDSTLVEFSQCAASKSASRKLKATADNLIKEIPTFSSFM